MASLHLKWYSVQVFRSLSLTQVEPDVREQVWALTEVTAVQRVMERHWIEEAGRLYVRMQDGERVQECWFDQVRLVAGQLFYEHQVSR